MDAETASKKRASDDDPSDWCKVHAGGKKKAKLNVGVDLKAGSYQPTLSDVQNLLLRIFTGEYGENPKWVCIRGMNLVQSSLVVMIPCLDSKTVQANESSAPVLAQLIQGKGALVMKSSGEVEHFPKDQGILSAGCVLVRKLLSAQAKPAVTCRRPPQAAAEDSILRKKPPISTYLASKEEMARSGYPDEEMLSQPGWVTTRRNGGVVRAEGAEGAGEGGAALASAAAATPLFERDPDIANLLALDCEMVMTASGSALARISVVGPDGAAVYDTLVKPAEKVTDYLTQFSGITEELLEGVSVSLADVQARLLELLSEKTILVGHSLENDLQTLQLVHDRVVDTVLIYPHARGWPQRQGLAGLSSSVLKKKLDRTAGHDSIADANVALKLALLKFEKGPGFGASAGESAPLGRLLRSANVGLTLADAENPLPSSGSQVSRWHMEGCSEASSSSAVAGSRDSSSAEAAEASQTLQKPQRSVRLEVLRGYESICQAAAAGKSKVERQATLDCLAGLDQQVAALVKDLPATELLILLNGCGDIHALRGLGGQAASGEEATGAEEKRRVREKFKDTFGVFMTGGAALQILLAEASAKAASSRAEATAPQRNLVSYDD